MPQTCWRGSGCRLLSARLRWREGNCSLQPGAWGRRSRCHGRELGSCLAQGAQAQELLEQAGSCHASLLELETPTPGVGGTEGTCPRRGARLISSWLMGNGTAWGTERPHRGACRQRDLPRDVLIPRRKAAAVPGDPPGAQGGASVVPGQFLGQQRVLGHPTPPMGSLLAARRGTPGCLHQHPAAGTLVPALALMQPRSPASASSGPPALGAPSPVATRAALSLSPSSLSPTCQPPSSAPGWARSRLKAEVLLRGADPAPPLPRYLCSGLFPPRGRGWVSKSSRLNLARRKPGQEQQARGAEGEGAWHGGG